MIFTIRNRLIDQRQLGTAVYDSRRAPDQMVTRRGDDEFVTPWSVVVVVDATRSRQDKDVW